MSRVFLILLSLLIASPALAKPIPDLSLTPEESFKRPDTPSVQIQQQHPSPFTSDAPPGNLTHDTGNRAPSDRFMDRYCDPNFTPLISTGRGNMLQSCLQDTRLEACRMFAKLPPDVQTAIDHSVNCADAAMAEEDAVLPPYCKNAENRRLQLADQYRTDPDTVHALTTLPEMVNNPISHCAPGNQ